MIVVIVAYKRVIFPIGWLWNERQTVPVKPHPLHRVVSHSLDLHSCFLSIRHN